MTILLVEDDADAAHALSGILHHEGYTCVIAHNGNDALSLVRTTDIALAILDYNLPDMLGDAVLQEIRKIKPALPVVMLSGQLAGNPILCRRLSSIGANALLQKPMDAAAMLALIRQHCP